MGPASAGPVISAFSPSPSLFRDWPIGLRGVAPAVALPGGPAKSDSLASSMPAVLPDDQIPRRRWTAALKALGMRHRDAYQTRHSYATWLINAYVPTWSRRPCNPWTTRSARGCHPCLRYGLSPMCPVRTGNGWRRRRDSNPGYRFWPVCSLSRGVPSTTRPRLRCCHFSRRRCSAAHYVTTFRTARVPCRARMPCAARALRAPDISRRSPRQS